MAECQRHDDCETRLRGVVAKVTKVRKALMSVADLVDSGRTVRIDYGENSSRRRTLQSTRAKVGRRQIGLPC